MSDSEAFMPPHGKPPAKVGETQFDCTRCGTLTPYSTMAHLGARCFACYQAFCRERPPVKSHGETPAQRDVRQ